MPENDGATLEQDCSPAAFGLDSDAGVLQLATREENRALARCLASRALRSIEIFTRNLDADIYDQQPFLEALTQLTLEHRNAQVRILMQDAEPVVKHGHRVIELSRKLTSFIQIRKVHHEYRNYNEAFLLADESGYLHRLHADRYQGTACFHGPLHARELLRFFTEVWTRSAPDPEMRRLHL